MSEVNSSIWFQEFTSTSRTSERSFSVNYKTPIIILQMVWLPLSLSIFLGILGNSVVLYGTIRHKALKLDKMSVWIAKNLSVADMCNCVVVLLPTLITQFKEGWMFGETLCNIHYSFRYSFFAANIFLPNVLSLNKLMRCLFLLRNLSPSQKQRISVTMATVTVSAIPTVWTLFLWSKEYLFMNRPALYHAYTVLIKFVLLGYIIAVVLLSYRE